VTANKSESAVSAMQAGINVELPSMDCYGDPLRQVLDSGAVDIELGLFENPYVAVDSAAQIFDTAEHRALAREIAQKSMVLLKNEDQTLPLAKDLGSIAVIGPNASNVRNLMGDYSYPAHIETLIEMMRRDDNALGMTTPDAVSAIEEAVPTISICRASETPCRRALRCVMRRVVTFWTSPLRDSPKPSPLRSNPTWRS
jgi:beta-glucosidase